MVIARKTTRRWSRAPWWSSLALSALVGLQSAPRSASAQEAGESAEPQQGSSSASSRRKLTPEQLAERRKKLAESRRNRRDPKNRSEARQKRAEERAKKRQARLESAAKKLEARAAALRKKAEAGKLPKQGVRPGAPPPTKEQMLRQADQLEAQAKKVRERAETSGSEASSPGGARRTARSPEAMRARAQQARRNHLRKRWGVTLRRPEARKELATHARRVAKLKRIRSVAQSKKSHDTARRATMLLAKEQTRHEARMKELQAAAPADQSATGASATAAPPSSATKQEGESK